MDKVKVALFPFNVYSKQNIPFLQEVLYDALNRELLKSRKVELVDKKTIFGLTAGKTSHESFLLSKGRELGASHIVTGSMVEIGNQINIDARVTDTATGKKMSLRTTQGKGVENIPVLATKLAEQILGDILYKLKISSIEIKGNKTIENAAIVSVIKSSPGKIFSESLIAEDIKSIYRLGYFEDVVVDVTDTPEGKVVAFLLKEKGLVTDVVFKGNKVLDSKSLEDALTFKKSQPLNEEKIVSSIEKMKILYDNKGYYNAEITYTTEKVKDKNVRVVFQIKENEKLYIRKITFIGNQSFTDKELKKIMTTSEKGFFYFLTDSGTLKKDQLNQDIHKLRAFYMNHGFIQAQVGEPEITFDKKGIYVKIHINEGVKFKVGKVVIQGDEISTPRDKLIENLKLPKKIFFDRESVIKDIEYLTQVCNDEGFAYAEVTPKTYVNEKEQSVDITYEISKGHLVYFNRINITGNTKTRDKVIRRMLSVVEGDLYNSTKLKESYRNLERLHYFEEIDFQTARGLEPMQTDLNIRVKEKPTGILSIGAGYSAQQRAMFMAQIAQQNLFGRGQTLSLKATLGSVSKYYELSFIEPWLFDIPLWSKFDLWNSYYYYDTYDVYPRGFSVTLSYPLWERIYGSISYSFYSATVKNIQQNASKYIKEQEGTSTTSSAELGLTRNTTDDVFFPSKGSINSISWLHAGGVLGGTNEFDKYIVKSSWYFSLPLDCVFNIRGKIGYLQGHEGKRIPVYEKFYVGGITSIRGLRYVGPKDPETGDVIGGETMMVYNAELIFPLVKNAGLKGVVFFDTGNAWEKGYHFDDMRKTAGIGVRWYSPIGPLRLEWGYVLDRKEGEEPYRWEFTIGMFM
ncbi:MAG: outer membrane protein assembly factor BamA [Syntrophales bacterium]|nr:outer membrane protein assembly factor BamA [Syntrophales bacterium]